MLGTLKKFLLLRKWLGQWTVLHSEGIVAHFPMLSGPYDPDLCKSLYLLHNSLPFHSAGYATRTQGLLEGLAKQGFSPKGVTRYGYPLDVMPVQKDELLQNNIGYLRLKSRNGKGYRQLPLDLYLKEYARALYDVVLTEKPAILHAASNFLNGMAAIAVGQRLGIPVVYEVRGLWELTRLSREPSYVNSRLYKLYVRKETECCLKADHVVAITESLKEILIERGVPAAKITVVSNAVSEIPEEVSLAEKNEIKNELKIPKDQPIIGYVGSLLDYEGLDDLITALSHIQDLPWHLVIVGDGAAKAQLEEIVGRLKVAQRVTFTGRVPFHEVAKYYAVIDICPFPRKALPVCEVVSPIKPFEAMAAGKIVLCSDVKALAEIVKDNETGFLFQKGSVDSLRNTLVAILKGEPEVLDGIRKRAKDWVSENRTWQIQARKISDIYKKLLK